MFDSSLKLPFNFMISGKTLVTGEFMGDLILIFGEVACSVRLLSQ